MYVFFCPGFSPAENVIDCVYCGEAFREPKLSFRHVGVRVLTDSLHYQVLECFRDHREQTYRTVRLWFCRAFLKTTRRAFFHTFGKRFNLRQQLKAQVMFSPITGHACLRIFAVIPSMPCALFGDILHMALLTSPASQGSIGPDSVCSGRNVPRPTPDLSRVSFCSWLSPISVSPGTRASISASPVSPRVCVYDPSSLRIEAGRSTEGLVPPVFSHSKTGRYFPCP